MDKNIKWIVIGVVLITGMVLFKPEIAALIGRVTDVEVSVDEKGALTAKIKAAIEVAEAVRNRTGEPLSDIQMVQIAENTEKFAISQLGHKLILWVDDNPQNNIHEAAAFRQLGITVEKVKSGKEALEVLRTKNVDMVISDFQREDDPRFSGYGLLDEMKSSDLDVPYAFYVLQTTPQYRANSKERGAIDQTNRPTELYSAVLSALVDS